MKKFKFDIENLDCANCAKKLENEINKVEGIQNCVLNFGTSKMTLESSLENTLEVINEVKNKIEPDCIIKEENNKAEESKKKNYEIPRLIIGIILAVIGLSGICGGNIQL